MRFYGPQDFRLGAALVHRIFGKGRSPNSRIDGGSEAVDPPNPWLSSQQGATVQTGRPTIRSGSKYISGM